MQRVLPIVTFLWRRNTEGFMLPRVCDYTAEHVNTLQRMLKRHLHIPHELICITDMPEGVECRTLPLWDKCRSLGGCYNRLYLFSKDMEELIGPRFVAMDVDVVIVDDVTPIFSRREPFLIHSYNAEYTHQKYNGSFIMMNAGVHSHVWESFDPVLSPKLIQEERESRRRIGTDQAWISMQVPDAPTVGPPDGVHEAMTVGGMLPPGSRMIFFSGRRDPSRKSYKWIREHYQ